MTMAMLLVLLGLGSWQVKRLFWKQALLAQIAHAEAGPPVPLAQLEPAGETPFTPSPYLKVSASGIFLPDETALYGAEVRDVVSGPAMGAQLIEPLREANGELVLVDRGWVPLSRTQPLDQPTGEVTVSGYVRPGDSPHWFSATDDPSARRFFTLDPKAIGTAIGLPQVQPFVLVVLATEARGGGDEWPAPAQHLPRPPNNHLSYAITWYGLAVALAVIFTIWARKGPSA